MRISIRLRLSSPAFLLFEDTDGEFNGFYERAGVGYPLAGYIESGAVAGRCPDKRQAQCDIYAVIAGYHLQRSQPLIVVHRDHAIELSAVSQVKKRLRRYGTYYIFKAPLRFVHRRPYDLDLFLAYLPALPAVRIQARDPYPRLGYPEIIHKRFMAQFDRLDYLFFGNRFWDGSDRYMPCHKRNLKRPA